MCVVAKPRWYHAYLAILIKYLYPPPGHVSTHDVHAHAHAYAHTHTRIHIHSTTKAMTPVLRTRTHIPNLSPGVLTPKQFVQLLEGDAELNLSGCGKIALPSMAEIDSAGPDVTGRLGAITVVDLSEENVGFKVAGTSTSTGARVHTRSTLALRDHGRQHIHRYGNEFTSH